MKTSRVVARTLKERGVKLAFGVPGGEVTDLMEGFRTEGIKYVLTRHEAAAAFMASAAGALTGIPGVCMATLGPGATNMVSGVAQAYLDRAPVIAFSGQLPGWRMATNTHQVLDLQGLYAPITKWRFRLEPRGCAQAIAKAVDVAASERPGPVYIEVPSDVGDQECPDPEPPAGGPGFSPSRTARHVAREFGPAGVEQAARLLAASQRPLLLIGGSALRDRATKALISLSEKAGLPVIVSPHGKSVFPETHAYFVGTLEMLATGYLFDLIESSDFLVTVGLDPVELMGSWTQKPGIFIDSVPNLDHYFESSVELVGPITEAVSALTSALNTAAAEAEGPGSVMLPRWTAADVATLRKALDTRIPAPDRSPGAPQTQGMYARELFDAMNRVLPGGAIVTCDVGAHKFATGQLWRAEAPGSVFITNGLSGMGFGLPTAIAAKLLFPQRTTVAVLGDGGLAMYAGEMDTARRLGTAVIIVVCVDHALSLIKMNQTRKGYPAFGSEFTNPDWAQVANGMGLGSATVGTQRDMEDALHQAMEFGGPFLIQARVDPAGYLAR